VTSDELERVLATVGLTHLRQRGGNLHCSCPSGTHADRRPSWGISTVAPHFHGCFSCGFKGTLRTLLIHRGLSPTQARLIAGEDAVDVSLCDLQLKLKADRPTATKTFEKDELFPYYPTRRSDAYFQLVRGLSMKTIRECNLLHDVKDNRVLFPWMFNGELVGLTGRTLSASEARSGAKLRSYLEGSTKRSYLYLPAGMIRAEPLIVVEGEGDALKVYDAGFRNVGAVTGRLSDKQADLMLNSAATQIVAFGDDDKSGRLLNRELAEKLGSKRMYREVSYDLVRGNYDADAKLDPGKLTALDIGTAISSSKFFRMEMKTKDKNSS
jgi:DNA primase